MNFSFSKGEKQVKSLYLQSQLLRTHKMPSHLHISADRFWSIGIYTEKNPPEWEWLILPNSSLAASCCGRWGEALPWSCTCRGGGWWNPRSGASYSGWGRSPSGRTRLFYCPCLPPSPAARAWKSKPRVHDFPLSRNFSLVTAEGGRASKRLQILEASSFPGRWQVWFKCLSCHSSSQVGVWWDCNPSKNLLHSWNKAT